jgi:hypothetical protein
MKNVLDINQQVEVLEILWYLVQDMEEKVIKTKNPTSRKIKEGVLVTSLYNFLNKVGYTKERPKWECTDIKEDPRQTKLKF